MVKHPWMAALLLIAAAAPGQSPVLGAAPAAGHSLYERLGGARIVEPMIGDLIDTAAGDPRTRRSFEKVNLTRLKKVLAEQICHVAGGACDYTGDSMHDAHAGLGITEAEFYGLVEELRDAMRRHGVALRERNELLAILAPMKRDVVER
jgi:hemoglobin